MCLQKSSQFVNFLKSATHCRFTEICMQNSPPHFADFLKSATHYRFTEICMQNPPHLLIFLNQPLDIYWHVHAGILPQVCRFSQISHWTFTNMWLQKFPPRFADFLKSATGHLLTCAYRNSLPGLHIFLNQQVDIYWHVLAEIPPVSKFSEISHSLQIYWNLHAEFPPFCRFSQISHSLQIYWNLHADFHPNLQIFSNQPVDIYWHVLAGILPICRFSQISQWTFTDMCLQKFPPGLQIFSNQPLDIYWHAFTEIPPRSADFLKSATHCRFTDIYLQNPPI